MSLSGLLAGARIIFRSLRPMTFHGACSKLFQTFPFPLIQLSCTLQIIEHTAERRWHSGYRRFAVVFAG